VEGDVTERKLHSLDYQQVARVLFCCRNGRTQSKIREVLCGTTDIYSTCSECIRETVYKVNTLLFYSETGNMRCS
jgi:hypothetical protein